MDTDLGSWLRNAICSSQLILTARRKVGRTPRGSSSQEPTSYADKTPSAAEAFQGKPSRGNPKHMPVCLVTKLDVKSSHALQTCLEMQAQGFALDLFCPAVPSVLIHLHSAFKQTHQNNPMGRREEPLWLCLSRIIFGMAKAQTC